MKSFGNLIVKFAVPIENFLIFDYEEFIKSPQYKKLGRPSEDSFLKAQFDYFKMEYDKHDNNIFPDKYTKQPKYSSDLALVYYQSVKNFTKLCQGIIFTGENNGHVLACYDPRIIVPLSYSTDDGLTFSSVELNKDYLKKVSAIKLVKQELPKEKPEDFQIFDYEFTEDGFLNVNESVILHKRRLTELPFRFGKVDGTFDCASNDLTSLKGAPIEVTGSFICTDNNLTSLKYSPKIVGSNFSCSANKLTTLEGSPSDVGANFECANNELISLKGSPKIIKGSFDCANNSLTSLKDGPTEVEEDYSCQFNSLISLEGAPRVIKGIFNCSKNKLVSLEGAPKKIARVFNCSQNKLVSLKGAPEEANDFFCAENNKEFSQEDVLAVCKVRRYINGKKVTIES
jgi:hypothetical protein